MDSQGSVVDVAKMALSRIEGPDELFVGGLWALRRSDALSEHRITHVLSLFAFDKANMKNFRDEPWNEYGGAFQHLVIDVDDVDDADLLVELPQAVRFIDDGLTGDGQERSGGVFVHCAAGKSRSVTVVVAYLLWRYPERFSADAKDPAAGGPTSPSPQRRKGTGQDAVLAALTHIRRTRPMAEPNDGFMEQLALWWEMGCPAELGNNIETHPVYQRWAYQREIQEHLAVGQAPSRLRFEDEQQDRPQVGAAGDSSNRSFRCKKCRRTLATETFILAHEPPTSTTSDDGSAGPDYTPIDSIQPKVRPQTCPHLFIEPLSWMRTELEKGTLSGRLQCPTPRCSAAVGRYDWKGFRCSCGQWVTPAFSLQRARVDEVVKSGPATGTALDSTADRLRSLGIRMPPGRGSGNL